MPVPAAAAKILKAREAALPGTVVLLFQVRLSHLL